MAKRVPFLFSIPLLGILAFHLICESMVIPILIPTLIDAVSETHDMLPGFSPAARKLVYGIVLSVYPIALFFCAPIIGALSDSIGRKRVLLATLIGAMLGCAAQGVAMEILSVWILAIGRIAVGVTAGVDGTIQAALIEKCSGKDQKNFYLGATLLAMSLGLMLGPAFAALFIDEKASALTWSLPFFIMAALFAVSGLICWCGISQVISNSVSSAFQNAFHVPPLATTLVLTAIAAVIVLRKNATVKSLDVMVPIMAVCYFVLTVGILVVNFRQLPAVLGRIFAEAFLLRAMAPGGFGAVLSNGVKT